MSLFLQLYDLVEVLIVDMGVHSEQTFQNGLGRIEKRFREGHTDCRRKYGLAVDL